MRFRSTTRGAAFVAALALALAACGGTDDEPTAETETEAADTDEGDAEPDGAAEPETDEADESDESDESDVQAGGIPGCAPEELPLKNPGTLTVATGDPVFPPWMMDDDPESGEGFENGFVYALADELGFAEDDVEWVRTGFDEAIAPGEKDYDFNIQQFSVTEDRAEIVDFSEVYYQPDKAVIALADSPVVGASSFAELAEANWGASIGTTDLDYLENIVGVEASEIAVFDDQAGVFQALQGGQIDATVAALPTALFATAVQIEEASITAVLPADPDDNGHGLLFEQGSELVDCIDEGIAALQADGTIDALVSEYLVGDDDIAEITE